MMFKAILGKEDPVIVEIGAHYGEDTLRFLEVFPQSTLYCFEPDPRNICIFERYVDDPRATLFTTALSSAPGTAMFYQSYQASNAPVPEKYDWIDTTIYKETKANSSGASSLKRGHKDVLMTPITVPTERFDKWHQDHQIGPVDLVWLDVQGAEREVIEGMGDAIDSVSLIWAEYGETGYEGAMTRAETINLLKTKNFVLVPQLSGDDPTGDLLFKRAENSGDVKIRESKK